MRRLLLPLTAALALTACGTDSTTSGSGTTTDNLFKIVETYIDPTLVKLNITEPSTFRIVKMTLERDDTDNGVDNFVLLKSITSGPFTQTYTDTITSSGTYNYRVTAYNAAGQSITTTQKLVAKVPTPLTEETGKLVETAGLSYPLATTAWTGGAGTVYLETGSATPTTISQAPLDAAGNFKLDLTVAPAAAQRQSATVDAFLGANAARCTGNAALSSNTAATMTLAHLRVAAGKSGLAAPLQTLEPITVNNLANTKLALGSMVYVDQPIVVSGAETCVLDSTGEPTVIKFALHLYKGWNRVTTETVTNSSGKVTSIAWSYEFRDGTNNQWVLLPQTVQITP